jgi:hypothetical protein
MFENIGSMLSVFILSTIIAGFFMWIGAKMAGIKRSGFGRALAAAMVVSLVTWVITGVFSILPILGPLVGYLVALLISIYFIKVIFDTTPGRAFLTWIFNIIAQLLALFIGSAILMGNIQEFFTRYLH